jgi:Fe-S-cluster-containing dehydrogenase component
MKSSSRRGFLKEAALLTAGTAVASAQRATAGPKDTASPDRFGVLVDTTVCIGCRLCEYACKKAHDLPTEPPQTYQDRSVFEKRRRPDPGALTVVNEYQAPAGREFPVDVKVQCMHCDHPACVSACIVGAFSKQENGSVLWDTDRCIGCRYCMVACPFQVPSFEYSEAFRPDIVKCDFCFERTKDGLLPACVEICPVGALTYGPRMDLVKVAREKIRMNHERYVPHIYGEEEAGGTSWLYLAGTDFSRLDFPDVGTSPMPGVSESIQHGIFAYFVPPVLLYALLGSVMWSTRKRKESDEEPLP